MQGGMSKDLMVEEFAYPDICEMDIKGDLNTVYNGVVSLIRCVRSANGRRDGGFFSERVEHRLSELVRVSHTADVNTLSDITWELVRLRKVVDVEKILNERLY